MKKNNIIIILAALVILSAAIIAGEELGILSIFADDETAEMTDVNGTYIVSRDGSGEYIRDDAALQDSDVEVGWKDGKQYWIIEE